MPVAADDRRGDRCRPGPVQSADVEWLPFGAEDEPIEGGVAQRCRRLRPDGRDVALVVDGHGQREVVAIRAGALTGFGPLVLVGEVDQDLGADRAHREWLEAGSP